MTGKLSPSDLVGAHEIAKRLGLAFPNIVHAWRRRHRGFPKPVAVLQAGLIWDWKEIRAWAKKTHRLPVVIEEEDHYDEYLEKQANAKRSTSTNDSTLGKSSASNRNELLTEKAADGEIKRTRHTPEQIAGKMREAEQLLAKGMPLHRVARHLGISTESYRRWRTQPKTVMPSSMARMKTVELENARLKKLLAEKELDNDLLRETAKHKK